MSRPNPSASPAVPSAQARECILDAAYAEIRRQGFQAASVAAILAETGLTKGALYHYFPSKKDLGLAVVDERVLAALRDNIFAALSVTDSEPAPLDPLLKLLDSVQAWDEESLCLGCPLNNLMQEMSAVDEDFRRHLTAIVALWQERVAALLRQAQAQGQVAAEVDCQAAALFIVAAWEGCGSIAKNMRSFPVFVAGIEQLKRYIRQLQPA